MKLNSMIYPGLEITEFVIKEEIENRRVLQHYQNTLVIRKENILHKLQYYDKFNAQLNKYVYVKTKYGIIKGYRSRYNRKGQMDFRYRIFNILESDMDAS